MNTDRLILVTGATGRQGGAALRSLKDRGFPVRAITRDPAKPAAQALAGSGVQVVTGDFNNPESLRRAMDGVYGVFAMSSMDPGAELEIAQGKALADAAQTSRVTHFVFTSVAAADENTGIPHFESKRQIELHVQRLGFPYLTILRPGFFMENWLWQRNDIAGGVVRMPLSPNKRLQQIAVADIGAFAAMAFAQPDRWYRKTVTLCGDELSMNEVAAAFAAKLGRDVHYQQIPMDVFEQQAGRDLATMFRWVEEKGYTADIPALRAEYPELRTFQRWLGENWR